MVEEKYSNNELGIMLKNLCDKVEDGFKGVHERQDRTNGNVLKNTEFRLGATGAIGAIKWILGFVGFGTIANIFLTLFMK